VLLSRKPVHDTHRLMAWLCRSLVGLMLLAGCSGGGTPAGPTPQPAVIRFTADAAYADTYPKLIEQFNKAHPGVTVQWVQVGGPGASSPLTCANCDVVRVNAQDLDDEQLSKYLSLDDIISASKGFKREDVAPGTMEMFRYGGLQVAVPAGLNPAVAFYYPEVFQSHRVNPPTADWSLDDLAKTARTLGQAATSNGGAPVYGFCSLPQSADPVIFAYLFGGQLVDDPNTPTRPTLNSKANIEAVQWYADLRRIYAATPDPAEVERLFGGDINRAIFGGRCGIWLGFYADHARMASYLSNTGRQAPAMLPLPRGRTPFGVVRLEGYAILKNSQHVSAAWQWIQFMLAHPEAAEPLLPPEPAQYRAKAFEAQVGKEVAAIATRLPDKLYVWSANLDNPLLSRVAQAYLDAVARVVLSQTDAESALNNAQAQAAAVFKRP